MYVEASYYMEFPIRSFATPRDRYRRYYYDLHNRYKISLDDETLIDGSQYKYHELAYPIFDKLIDNEKLQKIDTMIISYWAHEYDPDYATLGPHLSHRYRFSCSMFDILDQGSICAINALALIKKLKTNRSLCMSMDQTTIPRSDKYSFSIPSKTASAALLLSKYKTENSLLKIIDCEIWTEYILCKSKLNIMKMILKIVNKHNINIHECVLSCKRNSVIYRAILFYQSQFEFFKNIKFDFLPIQLGCTDVFQYIHQLSLNSTLSSRYYLYLDEDVESLTTGIVILETI